MKVLVFIKYYLPGFKAGGPLKSIQGLVDYLGEDVEFSILAGDRDFEDTERYPGIETNCWTQLGNSRVCYVDRVNYSSLKRLLSAEQWDLIYLQSFFDPTYTLKPLLWWQLGWLKAKKVLVATRGEFSAGAIKIRAGKKRAFLNLVRWLPLYKNVYWQASAAEEKQDILREIPNLAPEKRIFVACDVPPKPLPEALESNSNRATEQGPLRIIFISRITPKKNLEYALQVLAEVPFAVEFNIYGPIDHDAYWEGCQKLMAALPPHIRANYCGSIPPNEVVQAFASHDVFLFPTSGENFGHVTFEALQSGCSVVISDQTPWQDLDESHVGSVLPLSDKQAFVDALVRLNEETPEQRVERRRRCRRYAEEFMNNGVVLDQNRRMFEAMKI